MLIWAGLCGCMIALYIGAKKYDAPRPTIEYTWQDLEVPKEITASYEVLMHHSKGGTNALNITLAAEIMKLSGSWTNLLPHAEAINTAWHECSDGHRFIEELNKFSYISDWKNPDKQPDMLTSQLPSFSANRNLARLYSLHAKLLAQQGNITGAIHSLNKHYTSVRKGLPYSTHLITRMIFIALAKNDIETADQIIRNSECTSEQLNALKDRFSPLTAEELSWFRPVLAEYANAQYILDVTMQGELIEDNFGEELE